MSLSLEEIARVVHEANKAYCQVLGDNSQLPWDDAPQWQRDSAIKGVQFYLQQAAAGREVTPKHMHQAWLKEKVDNGWVYGPKKDVDNKQHPCCVPYEMLPFSQRLKDSLFLAVVSALTVK